MHESIFGRAAPNHLATFCVDTVSVLSVTHYPTYGRALPMRGTFSSAYRGAPCRTFMGERWGKRWNCRSPLSWHRGGSKELSHRGNRGRTAQSQRPDVAESWYVAKIKTTIPWDDVIRNLKRQDFDVYLPTVITSSVYFGGRKTIIEQPLFPAYIFILFDPTTRQWRVINNSTVGVSYLLPMNAEVPHPLPNGFIEELRTRKTTREVVQVAKRFLSDEVVRFISGTLAAGPGAVPRLGRVVSSKATKTRVALPVLGRETVVTVPTSQLELA